MLKEQEKYEVPEETFDKSPSAYRKTAVDKIKTFTRGAVSFLDGGRICQ
jgi:hypothetical protein